MAGEKYICHFFNYINLSLMKCLLKSTDNSNISKVFGAMKML
jgi:hypothetical protein